MTPAEFKAARKSLGLSSSQMATLLGVHPQSVRRLEGPATKTIPETTGRLVEAFLGGYRPECWPLKKTRLRSS
jgi:plasmid maintenance system antidote protein VapI